MLASVEYMLYHTEFGSHLDGGVVFLLISIICSVCLLLNFPFLNSSLKAE